jgi:hypothetical protein
MATPVKNIEKEFLLRVIYNENIPAIYLKNRVEYLLTLKKPADHEMLFQANQHIEKLKVKDELDLIVNYRSRIITFTVEVLQIKDLEITCTAPDFLYKDLDRSYSRVGLPANMQVQFSFFGELYNLAFPKVVEYETFDGNDFFQDSDLKNISGLIKQMTAWLKKNVAAYKLTFFMNTKPSSIEERVLTETGKTLFLPSTKDGFPQSDPFPQKRIITEDMFKRFLESTGVGLTFIDNTCARFVKAKADNNIFSDAWVPVLFHEYVIGYIHVWNNVAGKPPLNYSLIETLHQFVTVLTHSLKSNGYFDKGKLENDGFEGKIIDISASGLLFAYPQSNISATLRSEKKLAIKITTPQRSMTVEAAIVRRFKDSSLSYYGCQFVEIADDDLSHLFEYIYGKSFSVDDPVFLTGKL